MAVMDYVTFTSIMRTDGVFIGRGRDILASGTAIGRKPSEALHGWAKHQQGQIKEYPLRIGS
ncbi:uncharacterized protein Z520_11100 [Fonsecaea multimorphosa CBS 102226]|uniref:Uncharacterized protein n=1 Tax=Fonsecaea multimorphosa CBS 102226 TaxID=1442371 RepID=A0A0D2GUM2_9EURO|nr:uncharacterized protein Z520_11100 [Fonsecaea multimorphosa CBS 102226]KIX93245.1 hypothetical protein Z520_11100 [Fonsecaea multimorphosa CBS 102226]